MAPSRQPRAALRKREGTTRRDNTQTTCYGDGMNDFHTLTKALAVVNTLRGGLGHMSHAQIVITILVAGDYLEIQILSDKGIIKGKAALGSDAADKAARQVLDHEWWVQGVVTTTMHDVDEAVQRAEKQAKLLRSVKIPEVGE